jgi:myo-inositol 2-dehydrogenase / D-chiro-inositol 1-dehydrogenase
MTKVKVGIIGSRFQADCVAASVKAVPDEAELAAIASPTRGNAESLARRYGIPAFYADYREMLRDGAIDLVWVTTPNRLHARITMDSAQAGKHVVCEKPLCMTLEEADEMIDACSSAGVLLLYAEELFFAPKYVKAKQMADEGAFGRVHLVKQGEKHSGPHSDWFWDVEQSGGGALMDLGCHGIAFCWWFLGKPKVKSVYAQLSTQVHARRTEGDDEAITIIEFEGGAVGMVENSWNRPGGMDDAIEVFGAMRGALAADGSALLADRGPNVQGHVAVAPDRNVVDTTDRTLSLPVLAGCGALEREVDAHPGRCRADDVPSQVGIDRTELLQ